MATTFPINANVQPAVKDIDALIAALRKAGKEANLTDKEIDDLAASTQKAAAQGVQGANKMKGSFNDLNSTIKQVGTGLLAVFAADQIKEFVKDVVKVTAEFQKLEAVLTNTLGSKSEAQRALTTIKDIASKTPFSVLELTQSYVKLVNQGFKPTAAEITKLGDLAAAVGKQFDQLTEAIIDAQTGEFERLKEFGIRAAKEGDKVTFTFKGVKTQVDFTNDSIRNYILSLGDLEGVSGSMAAISQTLGGQLSNLGDAFDNLLNTIGQGKSGIISGAISLMASAISDLTDALETEEQRQARLELAAMNVALQEFAASIGKGDIETARAKWIRGIEDSIDALEKQQDALDRNSDSFETDYNARSERLRLLRLEITAVNEYATKLEKESKLKQENTRATKEQTKAAKEFIDTTDNEIELARWREQYEKSLEPIRAELAKFKAEQEAIQNFNPTYEADTPEQGLTGAELAGIHTELDARKQAIDSFKSYSIRAFGEIFASRTFYAQQDLALLYNQYNTELSLAGDNERAKEGIRQDFARREAGLLQKQAKAQQEQALFQIAIGEGPAIAKTVQSLGFPLAIPFLAAVALLFGQQIKRTRAVAQPRFAATGDFDIDGPGTETSDSIPYMLSVGESVTPARATRKFRNILKPMIEDPSLSYADIRNIIDENLPNSMAPFVVVGRAADEELVHEMRATRKAIENKKETHYTVDENGFGVWVGQQNNWSKYVSKRYSSKP